MQELFDFYNKYYEKDGYIVSIDTNEIVAEDDSIYVLQLPKPITEKLFSRGVTTISGLILIGNAFLQHNGFSANSVSDIYNALLEYLSIEETSDDFDLSNDEYDDLSFDNDDYEFSFEDVLLRPTIQSPKEIIKTKKEIIEQLDNNEDYEFSFDETKENIQYEELDNNGDFEFSFDSFGETKEEKIEHVEHKDEIIPLINTPIEKLGLSKRSYNALTKYGIKYFEELLEYDEYSLFQIPNLGAKSVEEVLQIINSKGKSGDNSIPSFSGDTNIKDLLFSLRAVRCLRKNNISQLSQIINLNDIEILNFKDITKSVFDEVRKVRDKYIDSEGSKEYSPSLFFIPNNFTIQEDDILLNNKSGHIINVDLSVIIYDVALLNALKEKFIVSLYDVLSIGYSGLLSLPKIGKNKVNKLFDLLKDYIEKNGIDYCNQEESIKKLARQAILSKVRDTVFNGIERLDLIDIMSEKYPKEVVIEAIEELIVEKLMFIYEGDKLFYKYQSFPSYVYHETKGLDVIRDIMFSRLDGITLEELGQKYSVTRELIRQKQEKFLKRCGDKLFREDRFKYIFETYNFEKDVFSEVFEEKNRTINYLYMKYKRGNKDYSLAVDDEKIPKRLRACIVKYLDRNKIQVDDVMVNKKDGLKFFVQKHIKKPTRVDDIVSMYNYFAKTYGFDEIDGDMRNLEGKIQRIPNTIFSMYRQIRYYNFDKYDFNEFLKELDLQQYKDIQISSLILFEQNKKLMKKYDIFDQYELHNILKRLFEGKDVDIKFDRMPMITFGNFDKKQFLIDIIHEYGEIGFSELANVLYERIGLDSLQSNWTDEIEEYKSFGKYRDKEQERLSESMIEGIKLLLPDDYYLITTIIEICVKNIKDFDIKMINHLNLNLLGFTVNSNYVVKKPHNATSYIKELLTKNDVFNLADLPSITNTSAFKEIFYEMKHKFDILEFESNSFINVRKLESVGFSKQDIIDYCEAVYDFVDDEYFTLKSLRQSGFVSELEDLGFNDIFYESLLNSYPDFESSKFNNVYIFKKNAQQFTKASFVVDIISRYQMIEAIDLIMLLKDTYGINVDLSSIKTLITDSKIYYNSVMDTFYKDYSTFIREV